MSVAMVRQVEIPEPDRRRQHKEAADQSHKLVHPVRSEGREMDRLVQRREQEDDQHALQDKHNLPSGCAG